MDEPGAEPSTDDLVCFIIGPIGDKLSDAGTEARRSYEQAMLTLENLIEPACHEAGILEPIRADRYAIAGEIPEQVFRLLRDADVVIADLTDANPNVMYELGLRHSLDKLTLQVGENQRLPFDVQTIRTVKFKRTEGGYIDAKNTLRAMIEQGLSDSFHPVTSTRIWTEATNEAESAQASDRKRPAAHDETDAGREAAKQLNHALQAREPDDLEDGPPGYIELLVELEDAMPRINATLLEINGLTEEFGDIARRGAAEVEEQDSQAAGARGRLVVAIRFAERLDEPVRKLEEAASRLRADAALVDRGLSHIFNVVRSGGYEDDETAELKNGLAAMVGARGAYAAARPSIEGFRDSADKVGNIARPVRVRVKRLTKALDQILETLGAFDRWGTEAEALSSHVDQRAAEEQG